MKDKNTYILKAVEDSFVAIMGTEESDFFAIQEGGFYQLQEQLDQTEYIRAFRKKGNQIGHK